jgi:ATP-dependent Clp protease adapter protein ClpS
MNSKNFAVRLHDDQIHTPDYVQRMLVKVAEFGPNGANMQTSGIHDDGSAIVFMGSRNQCRKVVKAIREFGPDVEAERYLNAKGKPMKATVERVTESLQNAPVQAGRRKITRRMNRRTHYAHGRA